MLHARLSRLAVAPCALLLLCGGPAAAADPPKVRTLRTQQVGDTVYFQVCFDTPAHLRAPLRDWSTVDAQQLRRLPQLVPQDSHTRAVYLRLEVPVQQPAPRAPTPVEGLEFLGKYAGKAPTKLLLLYPIAQDGKSTWEEAPVELDLAAAEKVKVSAGARERKTPVPPERDDLEGLWAVAQAQRFTILGALAPDLTFYPFAAEATSRKYSIEVSHRWTGVVRDMSRVHHERIYETTTGAAAIAESLQLERMIGRDFRDTGDRTIAVKTIPGIDIAEHPWKQMMGDKKPAAEPLAAMVPHDNWYLHCSDLVKVIELGELIDQWGTNLVRAYEVHSKDYQLRQRYEKQLCIKSTWVGKKLGPLVVRGLAVTGSDGYLREGTDVTLIFDCSNKELLLTALNKFIVESRKEWGETLKEAKTRYQDVDIESYVTPQREVSLHRAAIGNTVIYSNSSVGLRRVIDTKQGRHKALADSLDFQYMRTVFRSDDKNEHCFAFLSDAFIRQLVGPASKIKEKRRLEALTSLYMKTNEALFAAWENGPPANDDKLHFVSTVLKPEELYVPDGKPVAWEAQRAVAVSDVYNTLHFATPLIEVPIDLVTPIEAADYNQFRQQYMGLWRRYFDPIGMRFALTDKQVRVETYILPLVATSEYNELRRRTGGGTTDIDVHGFAPNTIVQFVMHLSPDAPERKDVEHLLGRIGSGRLDWLGKWFMIRFDDSPVYAELAKLEMRRQLDPNHQSDADEWRKRALLTFQMPVTVGLEIRNPLVFAGVLTALRTAVMNAAPDWVTWEPLPDKYKDVSIVRIQATPNGQIATFINEGEKKEPFLPAIYYANVGGAFYASLRVEPIKDLIDRTELRKQGKLPKPELVPVNDSLYLSPAAMNRAKEFLGLYLEMQSHQQALDNLPAWYGLHHSGLLAADATEEARQRTAMRFLGFVPVSPDGSGYVYESKTDEVVNRRHGSLRKPTPHETVEESSPLAQLLAQFRTIRTDLRFKEDGINTVLTIERGGK